MEDVVRLRSLEIRNIKNTVCGVVDMPEKVRKRPFFNGAEVLGIYGQNGSGKTAVIDALFYLQKLLLGQSLPGELVYDIRKGQEEAEIRAEFLMESGGRRTEAGYEVLLRRGPDGRAVIGRERLTMGKETGQRRRSRIVFMEYTDQDGIFTPKVHLDEVISGRREIRIGLMAAKKVAQIRNCSYVFGEASRSIWEGESGEKFAPYAAVIRALYRYAAMDLIVIRNSHSGAIDANLLLPMSYRTSDRCGAAKGDFLMTLLEPTVIEESRFSVFQRVVREINLVLQTMVPGLTIGLKDYGGQLMEDGTAGRRVDLTSVRGDTEIPIRYESSGIIKMISILHVLIRAYHDPGVCLAVDELDSGVYEYLLGELLELFGRGAKGQLIFTSHNLRPLEMLDEESILFSTANPENRFIRISSGKKSKNLRDAYIRSITLGGQKECIYSETDTLKMARAFRNAGRGWKDDF